MAERMKRGWFFDPGFYQGMRKYFLRRCLREFPATFAFKYILVAIFSGDKDFEIIDQTRRENSEAILFSFPLTHGNCEFFWLNVCNAKRHNLADSEPGRVGNAEHGFMFEVIRFGNDAF